MNNKAGYHDSDVMPPPDPDRKDPSTVAVVVLGIALAIYCALAFIPKAIGPTSQAKVAAAQSDLSTLSNAVSNFRLDCDRYPTTKEGLGSLLKAPKDCPGWKGPYVPKALPRDPWGRSYHYEYPGPDGDQSFLLESYGADGAPGGTDEAGDIISGR